MSGQLEKITFLDTETGLTYCAGSEELYLEVLETYLEGDRYEELQKFFKEKDWENYRIGVHALKSTSLSIGAVEMSEEAKNLEMAAKEHRIDEILECHAQLMEKYLTLMGQIRTFLGKDEGAEEAEAEDEQAEQETVLVVDDDDMNLKVADHILKDRYLVSCVKSGREALAYLERNIPNLILLDLHMPYMSGFEVMEMIQRNVKWREIPVVFLTADDDRDTEVKCLQTGAMDFITKPFIAEIVQQRVKRLLDLNRLQKYLQREVEKQTARAEERRRKVEQLSFQTVQALANAIDAKDPYTNGHSTRVSEYSALLAAELGWREQEVENIRYAALLHDIGKIGVPDTILNKPSRLTDMEYEVIKSHVVIGGDILKNITTIPGAGEVARYHHERFDGRGYPDHLAGEEIPLEARIVGVADAFDAMNSRRVYRKNLSDEIIREELVKGRGTQFDPIALDAFVKLFDGHKLNIKGAEIAKAASGSVNVVGHSFVDTLTGIVCGKNGENEIIESMKQEEGWLVIMDLNNLKTINDTKGFREGDKALQLLGSVLLGNEENCQLCRLGGDKFLIFIKEGGREKAEQKIREIMSDFAEGAKEYLEYEEASLSAGICKSTPVDVYAEVYNKADKALYLIKNSKVSGYFFYQKEEHESDASEIWDFKANVEGLAQVRAQEEAYLLLVTVEALSDTRLYVEDHGNAMECMGQAIGQNMGEGDTFLRYSSSQFLLILPNVSAQEQAKGVLDHIFGDFYKKYGNNRIKLSYAVTNVSKKDKFKNWAG